MEKTLLLNIILLISFSGFTQNNRFLNSIDNLKFSPKEVVVRNTNTTLVKLNYQLKMYEGKPKSLNLSKMLNFHANGAAQEVTASRKQLLIKVKQNTKIKDTIILKYAFKKRDDIQFTDTIITLNFDKIRQKTLNEIVVVEPIINENKVSIINYQKIDFLLTFKNGKQSYLSEYSDILYRSDFDIRADGPIEYASGSVKGKYHAFIEGDGYITVSLKNNPAIQTTKAVKINHNVKYVLDFDKSYIGRRGRSGDDGTDGRNGNTYKEVVSENYNIYNNISHNSIDGESGRTGENGRRGAQGANASEVNVFVNIVTNTEDQQALQVKTQKGSSYYTRYLPLNSDFSRLKIYNRGGDGGRGGHGGDGGDGGDGKAFTIIVEKEKEDPNDRNKTVVEKSFYYYEGNGGNGGHGGNGGNGGDGGDGGNVNIYYDQASSAYLDRITIINTGGDGGSPGYAGDGGDGGCRKRLYGEEVMNKGRDGRDGEDGERGYSGSRGRKGNVNYILQ
ncbi:MAG: hypothetical protein N4A35_09930 [Flavobacteriales bacterium]|jgi:hypothetical protein|nr:hypothetical protein [Flavobacteriales bacterium]